MELPVENVTTPSSPASTAFPAPSGFLSPTFYEVIVYFGLAVFGIFGNLLELFILHRARSSSNQKHVFMLRCMSTNDLIVLVGMMSQLFVSIRWPNTQKSVWSCRIRVLWRFFGMCSGCVAIVMAVERWVALTKPFFFYEKAGIGSGEGGGGEIARRSTRSRNATVAQKAEHDRDPMELAVTNATASSSPATPVLPVTSSGVRPPSPGVQMGVTGLYAFGIFGNLLALFILHRTRSSSNQKHGFMLRCLATNDCIALAGMLIQMFVSFKWPSTRNNVWSCRIRVLWRFFGLGSGCVAIVMAVERWLALTKPFFYQKHISLRLLKRMMVILWLGVLCLVCAPYFGFGLYWDEKTSTCVRYRNAKKPLDVLYAYLYFGHGVFLCFAIVYTNLAVMKALCMKDNPHNKHNVLMRRISRGSSLTCNAATKEERAFGWLMFLLCVAFVTCWVPQMISIPLSRFIDDEMKIRPFTIAADMLLAMHFALDPYLYVLQHWTLVKSICLKQKNKKNANGGSTSVSRSSSMRTTYEVFSQQPL